MILRERENRCGKIKPRILVVDDNEAIHGDFRKILQAQTTEAELDTEEAAIFGGPSVVRHQGFDLTFAFQGQQALELVKTACQVGQRYMVVFMDVRMPPGWDGLETSLKLWEVDPDLQVVICTAYSDKSWEQMMESVARPDRVLILKKPFDKIEVLQLAHALAEKWSLVQSSRRNVEDLERLVRVRTQELLKANSLLESEVASRKATADALRLSEQELADFFENASVGLLQIGADGKIIRINRTQSGLLGYRPEECVGRHISELHADPQVVAKFLRRLLAGETISNFEARLRCKNGSFVHVLIDSNALWKDGKFIHTRCFTRDITERKGLENQLFQSQKLETVGKLAGGVAHEFNNILTTIIGQNELMLYDVPSDSPLRENAIEIRKAADRATALTRQLLAYGRKQILQPETLDLNQVVGSMEGMLRLLLGCHVDVRVLPAVDLRKVKADVGQIEQVIMNMAINARDAMPKGGKLTIETANIEFDQQRSGLYPELKPGDYVMLAISDTGSGMSAEVKDSVFEPFFSTKEVGKGAGLGLSTCYGIIKQSGGHISVYSESGLGTTFKVYLPQTTDEEKKRPQRTIPGNLPRGTETILLVEDDAGFREVASELLQGLGYTVLVSADGTTALELAKQLGKERLNLLFTDVVMPEMNGNELSKSVLTLHPEAKVLFTTAYTQNAIVHQGLLDEGATILQKPFTPNALAVKVREMLDQN